MSVEVIAAAIYAAMNAGRLGVKPFSELGPDDGPGGPGRNSLIAWAQAAADVVAPQTEHIEHITVDVEVPGPATEPVAEPTVEVTE